MENNRKNLMFNALYRIGDDGAIVIPTFNIDELKRRHKILNSLEFIETQVIMLGGLNNYGEYQPVRTMGFEEAIEYMKKIGRLKC